jgi:AbrB family looped-hinge helix DNA binding protein
MTDIATTKLSSKGQVVIPENIRTKLHLEPGAQFVVLGDKDVIILKNISSPKIEEFEDLIAKARKSAKNVGLKKGDIADAIKKVRAEK